MNPTSCMLSAINPSTLDWQRGIQEISTYQLWGVCVRKVCVITDAYCEEVFRFRHWRSYQSFHLLAVKAFILQTWELLSFVNSPRKAARHQWSPSHGPLVRDTV
jgi:hypothetical protein